MSMTDYAQNKITDARWRNGGSAVTFPATYYFALICATKGILARSTAYAQGDSVVLQVGGKYCLYVCSTAGTTAAALPGTYLGARGEAISDGSANFIEQSNSLDAGTYTEVSTSGTGYARASLAASLANFAGTQAAASTTASSGTNGTTSNNAAISYGSPSAQWNPANGLIVGVVAYDALTGGNPWEWAMMAAPKSVNAGDSAPSIAAAAFYSQIGA